MSAKSNKIELSEEFMAMWREEQFLWDVMFPLYPDKNEKGKRLKRTSDKFHIFSGWYFRITFCFKCKIFFQLNPEILKFQLCLQNSIKTKLTGGHSTLLQLSIQRLVVGKTSYGIAMTSCVHWVGGISLKSCP